MQTTKKAVVLKYPKDAVAPFICEVAKGQLAEQIIQIATENNIKIVQDEKLTDFLSIQEIGTVVPETVWPVLAKIFAFVMQEM